jgi:catechol 2,3-dioxygenase-like lactoylglutathione lyase family enzyme
MFLYITLGTNNLQAAKRFYDAVMPTLGLTLRAEEPDELGYGAPSPARIQFWVTKPYNGQPATNANGAMPALIAPTRAAVDSFHAAGLTAGGTDEGKPGLRPYGPNFYACYLRDPDGNKLSAVCETPPSP